MPVCDMIPILQPEAPEEVRQAAKNLKFNSIAICLIHVTRDRLGDNLSVNVADRRILFHRLTKLDFLQPEEARDGTTRFMADVTYRDGDPISKLTDGELLDRVVEDMARLKFIDDGGAVQSRQVLRQQHAYVIYDLDHRRNMKTLREFCEGKLGMILHGRFGEFDYLNMDAVIERSMKRAREILVVTNPGLPQEAVSRVP